MNKVGMVIVWAFIAFVIFLLGMFCWAFVTLVQWITSK